MLRQEDKDFYSPAFVQIGNFETNLLRAQFAKHDVEIYIIKGIAEVQEEKHCEISILHASPDIIRNINQRIHLNENLIGKDLGWIKLGVNKTF